MLHTYGKFYNYLFSILDTDFNFHCKLGPEQNILLSIYSSVAFSICIFHLLCIVLPNSQSCRLELQVCLSLQPSEWHHAVLFPTDQRYPWPWQTHLMYQWWHQYLTSDFTLLHSNASFTWHCNASKMYMHSLGLNNMYTPWVLKCLNIYHLHGKQFY